VVHLQRRGVRERPGEVLDRGLSGPLGVGRVRLGRSKGPGVEVEDQCQNDCDRPGGQSQIRTRGLHGRAPLEGLLGEVL